VTPSTHFAEPDRAHRRRAQALGGSFAVTSALLGATVLRLSWRRVEQLQAPLPVDAALVTLTLAAVGLALLALGWTCALGAAAAGAPGIGSVAGAGACRRRDGETGRTDATPHAFRAIGAFDSAAFIPATVRATVRAIRRRPTGRVSRETEMTDTRKCGQSHLRPSPNRRGWTRAQ